MDDFDGVRAFARLFGAAVSEGAPMTGDLLERAGDYLLGRAAAAAGSDPDGMLDPSVDHPGYLTRELDGRCIFVPFNLASVSPAHDVLSEVAKIADRVRLRDGHPVCISGSATFLGAIREVGDLDYCEYYLSDVVGMPSDAIAVGAGPEVPLVWLKCGGQKIHGPWGDRQERAAELLGARTEKSFKLDFVSNGGLGLMPTTSVVLATGGVEDAARRSFVFQEAVVAGHRPAGQLVDPGELARYVAWLCEQVRDHAGDVDGPKSGLYAVKALKRALSLALATGFGEDTDAVVQRLRASELSAIVRKERVAELDRMMMDLPAELAAPFRGSLQMLREDVPQLPADGVAEVLASTRDIALRTLDIVEEALKAYG